MCVCVYMCVGMCKEQKDLDPMDLKLQVENSMSGKLIFLL